MTGVRQNSGIAHFHFAECGLQHGLCALCDTPFTEFEVCPQVDHDHKTGFIRGLLCPRCNNALGGYEKLRAKQELVDTYLARYLI